MSSDGWTENTASFESADLVAYLRLNRLLRIVDSWRQREGLDQKELCIDMLTLCFHIQEGRPLPGQPQRIDPT